MTKIQATNQNGKPKTNCISSCAGKYHGMDKANKPRYTSQTQLGNTFSRCRLVGFDINF